MTTTQLALSDLSKISYTPRRWGIYCRISEDRTGERLGVERQEPACRAIIPAGDVVVDMYVDNDISAASGAERKDYQRLLADLRSGRINGVATWHNDRLHRRPVELGEFIEIVEKNGDITVKVATSGDKDYDLTTPAGRAVAMTLCTWARYEWEMQRERRKLQLKQNAERGQHHGGGRRFGREIDMTIRESEADIVRLLAKEHLSGKSLNSLAEELNNNGVETVQEGWSATTLKKALKATDLAAPLREIAGRYEAGESPRMLARELNDAGVPAPKTRWTASNIGRMLRSPHMAGIRVNKGVGHPAVWPAILDEDTYSNLVALLAEPGRKSVGGAPKHQFAGLLRCGHCGHVLSTRQASTGKRGWKCDKKKGGCGALSRAADPMEDWLLERFFHFVERPGFLTGVSMLDKDEHKALLAELKQAEALQQETQVAYYFPDPGMPRLDPDAYKTLMGKHEQRVADINRRLRAATPQAVIDLRDLVEQGTLREVWPGIPLQNRRNALRWAINYATVLPLGLRVRKYEREQCFKVTWNVQ